MLLHLSCVFIYVVKMLWPKLISLGQDDWFMHLPDIIMLPTQLHPPCTYSQLDGPLSFTGLVKIRLSVVV